MAIVFEILCIARKDDAGLVFESEAKSANLHRTMNSQTVDISN